MFGLEDGQSNKVDEFSFDLEKELKDHKQRKEIVAKAEDRIRSIKKILNEGEKSKDLLEQFGLLMQSYEALIKTVSRLKP